MAYPPPAVGQVSLITYKGTLDGQMVLSTFVYSIATLGGSTTIATAATALYNKLHTGVGFESHFLMCCPPQYNLDQVWIQNIFPTRYLKNVFLPNNPGTFTADAHTANLAATITRRGVQANKHNVGSLHLPYANEDAGMTGGSVSAAMITAMGIFGNDMVSTQTTAAGEVWQPGLFPAKATSIAQFVPLFQTIPQTTVRVMRRRTVGLGK